MPKKLSEQRAIISRLRIPSYRLVHQEMEPPEFLEKVAPLVIGGGNPASAFARSAVQPTFVQLFQKLVEKRSIGEADIFRLHSILAPESESGLRKTNVRCGGFDVNTAIYVPPPPKNLPGLFKDILFFVNEKSAPKRRILLAMVAAIQFVIVHPFMNGNGRVSRAIFALCACRGHGYSPAVVEAMADIWSGNSLLCYALSYRLCANDGWYESVFESLMPTVRDI